MKSLTGQKSEKKWRETGGLARKRRGGGSIVMVRFLNVGFHQSPVGETVWCLYLHAPPLASVSPATDSMHSHDLSPKMFPVVASTSQSRTVREGETRAHIFEGVRNACIVSPQE